MTSPFTMAVALTTDGIALPNNCGFSGSFSDSVLLAAGGLSACPESCATAPLAASNASAPPATITRVRFTRIPAATVGFSLSFPMIANA
jgi:hypothetical protein